MIMRAAAADAVGIALGLRLGLAADVLVHGAQMHGTPRPRSYSLRTSAPGPFGATRITSMSARGSICLKCTLKPCANSSAAPGLMFGSIASRYSVGCTMSGVSTATRSAPFTASAGSTTLEAVGFRLVPGRAVRAQADHDVEAGIAQVQRMRAALAAVAEHGDAG